MSNYHIKCWIFVQKLNAHQNNTNNKNTVIYHEKFSVFLIIVLFSFFPTSPPQRPQQATAFLYVFKTFITLATNSANFSPLMQPLKTRKIITESKRKNISFFILKLYKTKNERKKAQEKRNQKKQKNFVVEKKLE